MKLKMITLKMNSKCLDILEIIKNKGYVQIDQELSYEDQYQILGVNTPEQLKEISMKYANFL